MEAPGTAPGSSPLITKPFIAIDRVAPDKTYIGINAGLLKSLDGLRPPLPTTFAP
ncbi:hypothetical protein GCM10008941_28310 [Rhizomicrobium palustre]